VSKSLIQISVIIPVYNAEQFIEKAVASALEQPQTAEVILVEDGSSDSSFDLCKKIQQENDRVRLFTHANHANKGAGASRNLGITKATYPYISFLDADDFFLPNRFEAEQRIFSEDRSADGVYGALGFYFYSDTAKDNYKKVGFSSVELTTITEVVSPENLKWVLLDVIANKGSFSIVTLTVKKSLIEKSGLFPDTQLGEDTVFIIKLAFNGRLKAGIIDRPIGLRGAHDDNRVTKLLQNKSPRLGVYKELYRWSVQTNQPTNIASFLLARKLYTHIQSAGRIEALALFLKGIATCAFFRKYEYFFNAALSHVVVNPRIRNFIIRNKERIQQRVFRGQSSFEAMKQALEITYP